jgi:hypothetical protein
MSTNRSIQAHFGRVWSLTVNEGTGGEVTRNSWEPWHLDGSTIQLAARAYDGFAFTGWQGDAAGLNPAILVAMITNRAVQARFASTTPTFDLIGRGEVRRVPEKPLYSAGERVELIATPRPNYTFHQWEDGPKDNPRTIVIGANNHYRAIFTRTNAMSEVRLKEWERDFGGTRPDQGARVLVTADGGYLLAGSSASGLSGNKARPGPGGWDGWLIKLDRRGEKEWEQVYGGLGQDFFVDAKQTPEGGYVLGGYSNSR